MERMILPGDISADQEVFYKSLLDSALGNPIILEAAPTTADGKLKENQLGFYGTNLYITLNGTTYKFTGVAV